MADKHVSGPMQRAPMIREPSMTAEVTEGTEADPVIRCIVARGHSVEVPFGPKVQVGFTPSPDSKPVFAQKCRTFGPNQELELPQSEVTRLRKLGFLVDPDYTPPEVGEGPQYREATAGSVGYVPGAP